MTPSKLLIRIGISILVLLPAVAATADEPATPSEVAELAARERQLRVDMDERLRASVLESIENESRNLASRTTAPLQQRVSHVAQRDDDSPPPAKRALTSNSPTILGQRASNTTCTSVGWTLECVLRDSGAP